MSLDVEASELFLDLFRNYDLTNFRVYRTSFLERPRLIDGGLQFGWEEGARLYICAISGEVREISFEEIVNKQSLAKSFDHFAEALLITAEYAAKFSPSSPEEIRTEWALRAARAAGGKPYAEHWCFDSQVAARDDVLARLP